MTTTKLQTNTISLLKKINFTLLILTTVIVLFSFFSSKSDVDKAINDLENLENVFVKLSTRGVPLFGKNWLNDYAQDYIKENNLNNYNDTLGVFECYFIEDNRTWGLRIPSYYLDLFKEEPYNFYIDTTITLQKVKLFWDKLYQTYKLDVVVDCPDYKVVFDKDEEKFKYYELERPEEIGVFSAAPKLRIIDITKDDWIDQWFPKIKDVSRARELLIQMTYKPNVGSQFYAFGDMKSPLGYDFRQPGKYAVAGNWKEVDYSLLETTFQNKVFYPINLKSCSFSPIDEMIAKSPKDYAWKKGDFRTNFKELDKLTTGFQDLNFSKLKAILDKDSKNLVDSINIFGVKIPYSIINRFGILAIIIVQLYFGIYLNQLKLNEPSELPWMLFHKSLLSQIVFYLSAIIYPTIVVFNLSILNIINTRSFIKDSLICLIELIIIYWLSVLIQKIRKNYRQHL